MFRLLILSLYIFSVVSCTAQISQDEVSFLEKIIKEKKADGEIVYTNHIGSNDAYKVLLKIRSNNIVTDNAGKSFVTINKQERKEIEKKFEQYSKPYWNDQLFSDSKMIEEKNVMSYFKTVYNEYSETLSNPNNSQVDKSKLLNNSPQPFVFEFTPPFYLGDKTICFCYIKTLCGNNCGSSELAFYKKENNGWNKVNVVAIE